MKRGGLLFLFVLIIKFRDTSNIYEALFVMLCILIFFRRVALLLVKTSALAYNPVESKPSHDFFSIQYPSRGKIYQFG